MGVCYIEYTTDLGVDQPQTSAAYSRLKAARARRELTRCRKLVNTLNLSRLEHSDPQHLNDVFALYNHLQKKANILRSIPIDTGHPYSITVINLLRYVFFWLGLSKSLAQQTDRRMDLLSPRFGHPGRTWFIEWEAFEKIFQMVEAKPARLPDGTYRTAPGAVSFVTALRKDIVSPFLQRLEDDQLAFLKATSAKL